MKKVLTPFLFLIFISCNNSSENTNAISEKQPAKQESATVKGGHYEGAFTNGMKETFISFDISEDGKKLDNLTFDGYWRCDGKLEQTRMGPEKGFDVLNNKVDAHLSEPEDGGATAIRYQLKADIDGKKAKGSFRMNINALSCDTYLLHWTAERK